jgi:succinate dehydrogenase / fumarate reductase cytochrome b subunit
MLCFKGGIMPRRDLIKYPKNCSYTMHPGYVMFILHRITGIILGIYIIMHILGSSTILTPFHEFVQIAPVRFTVFIIFLLHGLNGLRIILVDFFNGAEREHFYKQNFTVILLFIIIAILGALPIFI